MVVGSLLREKQFLILIQNKVVHIFHDSLQCELNNVAAFLCSPSVASLIRLDLITRLVVIGISFLKVLLLFKIIFLPGLVEKSSFKWL